MLIPIHPIFSIGWSVRLLALLFTDVSNLDGLISYLISLSHVYFVDKGGLGSRWVA